MASFYGYTILLVGLSILLAIAGLHTGMGSLTGHYFHNMQNADYSFNSTSMNSTDYGIAGSGSGSSGINWLYAIMGITGTILVGIALATKDPGATIKSGFAAIVLGFGISDFVSLLQYARQDSTFGGIVAVITFIVYMPLAWGYIISAINWIGGKD